MAKYSEAETGEVFAALADPTRRTVVGTLGRGPASVSDLARAASMTLPSFLKHVTKLERCGLVSTTKHGRVRTCSLNRERLGLVDGWLADQRATWTARTDRLEAFVTDLEETS